MHGKSKEYDPQKLLVAFLFLEQENKNSLGRIDILICILNVEGTP